MSVTDFEAAAISDSADSADRRLDLPHGNPPRSARLRAKPTPEAAPAALSPHPGKLTESDETPAAARAQQAAQEAASDLAERARTWFTSLASGPSLLHVHPPTLAQHHQRARECAAAHSTPAMACACLAYRHLHWLLKLVLNAIEWCTDSFPKLIVTGFVVFVAWHWI